MYDMCIKYIYIYYILLYPDPKKGTLTATVTNFAWGIQIMSKYDYHIIKA